MTFEFGYPLRVVDKDRNISVRFRQEFGGSALDSSLTRTTWGFEYINGKQYVLGRYYSSGFRYSFVTSKGAPYETSCENIFVIPVDTALASFKLSFPESFGVEAKQSEIDIFLSDIDQAFRCHSQPRIESAERHLGRKPPWKIIFFDAFPGEKVRLPVNWPPINNRALEILIKEERESA